MTGKTKDELSLWGIFVFLAGDVVFAGYAATRWFSAQRESNPTAYFALVVGVVVALIVVGYSMFARIESGMDELAEHRAKEEARLKAEDEIPPGAHEGNEGPARREGRRECDPAHPAGEHQSPLDSKRLT